MVVGWGGAAEGRGRHGNYQPSSMGTSERGMQEDDTFTV